MLMEDLVYFINNQENSSDIWNFILYEQPGRCGWRHMYNYQELELILRFCSNNDINIDIDLIMSYLKVYKTFNVSYNEYISKKTRYDTMIFNIYYNHLLPVKL